MIVYVVDAWDDDAQESYVKVFRARAKAVADLERWEARRKTHDTYAGIVKRSVQ
jgi:hypothetical protein